ncbi:FAD-dependent oxidoreductase [Chitinophaga varians]|uniref:FAD-dependent oxidoreductase n=1 Tax=Chitinophaga varians TaxID=2202339 RepID=UPI00165F826D|nr:FAD-dependent oxidoreductase [Chitinophaga varians]MBC9914865.1 FAD-dependent oxidoreductase [Chitinophaga varians]
MKRRNFLEMLALSSGAVIAQPALGLAQEKKQQARAKGKGKAKPETITADVIIAGGGLGGVSAALAALHNQQTVVLTEETEWIGGQLTQQGVPPDEHPWIETHGAPARYRELRNRIREYYVRNYPLTADARQRTHLNPGDGSVSRLCHEPKVALAVMLDMLTPFISNGQLVLLIDTKVVRANVSGNKVLSLAAEDLRHHREMVLQGSYFVDATEMGDLLPLTGTEFVTGTESRQETGELHAPEKGNPENNQAFTVCFALDYVPGGNFVIEKPAEYEFWRNHVPKLTPAWSGRQLDLHYSDPRTLKPKLLGFHPEGIATGDALNLWNYRRIINKGNFEEGMYSGDVTIVNWPQNDYMLGNLIGASPEQFHHHVERAKQLNLSLIYWLQTEAPRPDGGKGWPGIRLRKDIMGTADGMAKYPYIREARRIKAVFTVLEEHVGAEQRAQKSGQTQQPTAATFHDSVGVGYYHIDLHPSCAGVNYVDFGSLPYQIPLGALLPQRMENLLPANKNIGTTHITNGCYRVHPTEWSIGEAVGNLIAFARSKNVTPRQVREQAPLLQEFQDYIRARGVETAWT